MNFFKRLISAYNLGEKIQNDLHHNLGKDLIRKELSKKPKRTAVINFLLQSLDRETTYLEIGVRHPQRNFDLIKSDCKYGVDPGYENIENPVDFKLTSDDFFESLKKGKILTVDIRFDVIFIDGMHLANQVERDINNALSFIKNDGFIVLHDCNPPMEFNASEIYDYRLSPASGYWTGTTWKAFFKARQRDDIYSCCIDSDWGIGIISKKMDLGTATKVENPFFEYQVLASKRVESLNLISFRKFKDIVEKNKVSIRS